MALSEARRAYLKAYRENNREKLKAQQADWYQRNREAVQAQQAGYYEANRDKVIARQLARYQAKKDEINPQQLAYQRANPERRRELARLGYQRNVDACRERARLSGSRRRSAIGEDQVTFAEWEAILEEFDRCCAYCQERGGKLTIEHLTPLSRGGRHLAHNVVPACKSCNSSKRDRTLLEFAAVVPMRLARQV